MFRKRKVRKFKYFSRSRVNFQVLFKMNLVFKDFSRQPSIFKFFKPVQTMYYYKKLSYLSKAPASLSGAMSK